MNSIEVIGITLNRQGIIFSEYELAGKPQDDYFWLNQLHSANLRKAVTIWTFSGINEAAINRTIEIRNALVFT